MTHSHSKFLPPGTVLPRGVPSGVVSKMFHMKKEATEEFGVSHMFPLSELGALKRRRKHAEEEGSDRCDLCHHTVVYMGSLQCYSCADMEMERSYICGDCCDLGLDGYISMVNDDGDDVTMCTQCADSVREDQPPQNAVVTEREVRTALKRAGASTAVVNKVTEPLKAAIKWNMRPLEREMPVQGGVRVAQDVLKRTRTVEALVKETVAAWKGPGLKSTEVVGWLLAAQEAAAEGKRLAERGLRLNECREHRGAIDHGLRSAAKRARIE